MSKFSEKGYFVKENAPIYLATDMDKTARWFEDVLGWYSNIVERDSNGEVLSKIDMYAYYLEPEVRNEIQFIWYLDI